MVEPIVDENTAQLEIARLKAEISKIEAETREVNRPILLRPAFWGALVPGIVAALAAWFAISGDFFDAQKTLLDARKAELSAETIALEVQKNNLDSDLRDLKAQIASAENEVRTISREKSEIERRNEALNIEVDKAREKLRAAEEELANLEVRLPMEPVRRAIQRIMADVEDSGFDESSGPMLVGSLRSLDDAGLAVAEVEGAIEQVDDQWRKSVFLISLLLFEKSDKRNDDLANLIAAAAESGYSSWGFWINMVTWYPELPIEMRRKRCDAISDNIKHLVHKVDGFRNALYAFESCHRFVYGRSKNNSKSREAAKAAIVYIFSHESIEPFYCSNIGNYLKDFGIELSDLAFAKCLSSSGFQADLQYLTKYTHGDSNSGIPPSKLTSLKLSDWRSFYEQRKEEITEESLIAKL